MTRFECIRCWVDKDTNRVFHARTSIYLDNVVSWEEYVEEEYDDEVPRMWITIVNGSSSIASVIEYDYDEFTKLMDNFEATQTNPFPGYGLN